MFLLRGWKQTLCGNKNPSPKSTERKSRCEAPVSPGKQQYIPKHCPTLCYVYTVILKHMMLHLQIHKLYLYS